MVALIDPTDANVCPTCHGSGYVDIDDNTVIDCDDCAAEHDQIARDYWREWDALHAYAAAMDRAIIVDDDPRGIDEPPF